MKYWIRLDDPELKLKQHHKTAPKGIPGFDTAAQAWQEAILHLAQQVQNRVQAVAVEEARLRHAELQYFHTQQPSLDM